MEVNGECPELLCGPILHDEMLNSPDIINDFEDFRLTN